MLTVTLMATPLAAQCGAPNFNCSPHQTNAQLTVEPIPYPYPSIGGLTGAGDAYTPTFYGNKIIRCTDVNTDPSNSAHYSYEVTDSGGNMDWSWNTSGQALRVMEADTGSSVVLPFSNSTGCGPMVPGSKVASGATWSRKNLQSDYYLSGTVVYKRFFSTWTVAPTVTQLVDLAQRCPSLSGLTMNWHSPLSLNSDDSIIGVAFSTSAAQDTGQYAVVYNQTKKSCQVFDTYNQVITGTSVWGASGTPTTSLPFLIHDMFVYPGGWVVLQIAPNTCPLCPTSHTPFFWDAGTLTVNQSTLQTGGHDVAGYSTYINIINSPEFASRQMASPDTVTDVTSAVGVSFPQPQDTHEGWQNVDSADSYPVWFSQMSFGLPQPMNITQPLQGEIAMFIPASGEFIRVAPCMSSGIANQFNFRTQYCIGSMSHLMGKIAFSTDWEGTLGNTDGVTSTCTLGAAKPNECRSDVAVVIVK